MDAQNTYPELYFSKIANGILESEPPLPEEPVAPKEPKRPIDPGEYDSGGERGFFILLLIGAIALLIFIISWEKTSVQLVLTGIGMFLIALFFFKTTTWEKQSHENKKAEYKKANREYPSQLDKYKRDYQEYLEDKAAFDIRVKLIRSSNNVTKYRANKILAWLSGRSVPQYSLCQDDDAVKKGASEDYFASLLKDMFYPVTNQRFPAGTKYYYPDIVIECKNLYFNIEIDEPYAGNTGAPIHYLSNESGYYYKSVDKGRNEYMTEHGWEVIRFSEEQIFLHPEACIQYISDVIDAIVDGTGHAEYPEEYRVSKWTKEQSSKFAYQRFRATYVPKKYQKFIDKEDYRTYEEMRAEID